MAKGKKATSKTVAILPAEKCPFSVPQNWIWTDIDSINHYVGTSIDPLKQPDTLFELYSVPSSADDYPEIIAGSEIGSTKQSVMKNDVLLCKINPRINRVWKVSQHTDNELMASSEWIIVRNSAINPDYLMYCFRTQYFREYMLSNVSGVGGSLMRAQPKFVKNYPVPIAPFAEQQRIVDRIESLFAKLDEAKEKAQAVVDGFELRKSAILHRAFTGELTKKWRQEHGVGMERWETRTLDSVCESIFDGDHMPPPKSEQGIPFLVISNVNNGHLSFENTRFVPQDYYDSLSNTRKPQIGDVLYTLVGSYGIPVVVDDEKPFCFQRHMALLKPKDVDTYFLWYLLQSQEMFNKASAIATGTAQLTVPIKGLRQLEFQRPTADEQTEIVRILDDLLFKEQQAKDAAEAVLDQIDTMKKAILARAFRGELGTNDPSDESAVELLRGII
jgi:type I restriction enzyme S subunit